MVKLTHVGIVGAGQMGSGIAQVCAAAGLNVSLVDVSDAALDRGMAAMGAGLERLVKKGTLSASDKQTMHDRAFLQAKLLAARFYADHVLSRARSLCHAVVHGADSALAIDDDQL